MFPWSSPKKMHSTVHRNTWWTFAKMWDQITKLHPSIVTASPTNNKPQIAFILHGFWMSKTQKKWLASKAMCCKIVKIRNPKPCLSHMDSLSWTRWPMCALDFFGPISHMVVLVAHWNKSWHVHLPTTSSKAPRT